MTEILIPPRRKPHPILGAPDSPCPNLDTLQQSPDRPSSPHSHSGSWVPPSCPRPRPLLRSPRTPQVRAPTPPRPARCSGEPDLLRALEADPALGGSEPTVQAAAERQGVQRAWGRRRRRGRRRGSGPRFLVAGQAPGSRLRPVVLLLVAVAVPGGAASEGRPAAAASPAPPGLRLGPGPPPARQHQQLQLVQEHAEPRLEHRPGTGGRGAASEGGSRAAGGGARTRPGRGRARERRTGPGSPRPASAVHCCHRRGSRARGAERAISPGMAGWTGMARAGAGGGEGAQGAAPRGSGSGAGRAPGLTRPGPPAAGPPPIAVLPAPVPLRLPDPARLGPCARRWQMAAPSGGGGGGDPPGAAGGRGGSRGAGEGWREGWGGEGERRRRGRGCASPPCPARAGVPRGGASVRDKEGGEWLRKGSVYPGRRIGVCTRGWA